MNHLKLFVSGLCIILISHGCGGGGVTGGVGFIPTISTSDLLNFNDPSNPKITNKFTSGDNKVGFDIEADDGDLDMKTLLVTFYDITDPETPIQLADTIAINLPKQTAVDVTYSNIGPINISEPAGNYKVNLQIEDARGNKSATVFIPFTME
jgi:hypothetical protein